MKNKKIIRVCLYLTIALLNLFWLVSYAGYDYGLAWVMVIPVVVIVGFIIGLCPALLFSKIFKVKLRVILAAVISFILSFCLLFAEIGTDFIYDTYVNLINRVNSAERRKSVHEIALGSGKILYFKNEEQDIFDLNFQYQGKSQIGREQLIELAKDYCLQHGYNCEVRKRPISLEGSWYEKFGVVVKREPGFLWVKFDVKNGPYSILLGSRLVGLCLQLRYSNGKLKFIKEGETIRG